MRSRASTKRQVFMEISRTSFQVKNSMERTDKGWYFDYSVTNENTLKPLCVEVEKHFTLPARRLLRYFAASDDFQLRQEPPVGFGTYYRGFHVPLSGRHSLPMHLQSVFFHPWNSSQRSFLSMRWLLSIT